MAPLKIGTATLPHGVMLAPMAGVTDHAFRATCRRFGAEYTVSEMVSAKALCYEQRGRAGAPARTAELAVILAADGPMAIQLFGSEPAYMAEAAKLIESGSYRGAYYENAPVAIDINMGCPVPKVVSNGEGAALMRTPELAAEIVTAVKKAVSLPVTVKCRAGWDDNSRNAVEFAKRMEAAGADLITVHGRTRQQFYAPSSDNKIIALVKAAVRVPVIGNGDLFTAEDVVHILKETGCDGVMIARGALGNPFLFAEIAAHLNGKPYEPPTLRERLSTALFHAAAMAENKGEAVGIAEARKHMAWYCKGIVGAAAARDRLMHACTLKEIEAVFEELLIGEGAIS